ncbi:hypothetical protein B9P82_22165 [Citrobacter sp. L55]|nr:hypothetical protein [Salmonella enterica subsp. enterica]MJQ36024.1 hypothetical protein [Salmonella enterica subsp. enterica]MLA26396.1 hypothetical protein [Salmonella enterica subsp. enterica serovar Worthington]PLC61058.1 hypothetical protein B9P82_22165 [Citrobacter sp. L55]
MVVLLFHFFDKRSHIDEVELFAFADLFDHHLQRLAFASSNGRSAGLERCRRETLLFVGKDGVLADCIAAMGLMAVDLHFRTAQRITVVSGDRRDFRQICSCGHASNRSRVLTY